MENFMRSAKNKIDHTKKQYFINIKLGVKIKARDR